ncbi:MAG: hypothetical protein BroJett040_22000 [Oligoflexia bacterium]|nr:MAG: hypothetical protein BroJett040_22000 [Oligoflexia bacterium]
MKKTANKLKNVTRFCLSLSLMMIAPSAMLITGCTKPRPATFAQNQGIDLQEIAALDGQTFDLITGETIGNISVSKADKVNINSQSAQVGTFNLVKFKTDAKLLKEIPFQGRPNHKYQVQYRLTDKYLKIYKIAQAKDLSLREKTIAEKMDDGRFAVPLMGYPVTYYTIDRIQNDNGERTSKMIEVGQNAKSKATHFKINMNNYTIFKALEKVDVIPASMFDGEWYFSETIISTPENEVENVGMGRQEDQNLENANRIKFLKYETFIKAVNVNIDERLKKESQAQGSDVNYAAVMSIPAQWKDYRLAKSGSDTELSEEENTEITWDKRKYVEINANSISTALLSSDTDGNGINLPSKLVNFEINDNYISFTIQKHSSNTRVRYSFLKAGERNYQPKVHFEKDFKKFGYFTTQKASIQNYEIRRKEDAEKNNFISRFNPSNKTITFNFTTTSPEWARGAAAKAVEGWNNAFQEAGTGINVVLDTTKDVELGDLRYNAINLIESRVSGSLFGFGPSVTDPLTGEIISATSNVHITPIRSALDEEITNYVRVKIGEMNGSFVSALSSIVTEMKSMVVGNNKDTISVNAGFLRKLPELKVPVLENGELVQKKVQFKADSKNFGREFSLGLNSANIHQEIEAQCPEVLKYIEDVKAEMKRSGKTYTDAQNEVQDSCSKKLVTHKMLGTLIHEMGHNLGLRHNFMGSTDYLNFWDQKKAGTDKPVRSSSVMEYPAFNEDRLTQPGAYDIAAIRYGYADAVEIQDGDTVKIAKLNPKKSIEDNVNNAQLKKYAFCTDEDVFFNTNPMCQRHDAGVTPEEIVDNMIRDYNASFATLNYRYDKTWSADSERLAYYRLGRFFLPMKRFYDEWRSSLARYLGINNRYLENYTQAQLDQKIAEMAKDPNFEYYAKHYRVAADKAFKFLKQIAFMPSKYCVAKYNNSVDLVDFESIRETIFFSTNQSVKSCVDDHVKTYLGKNMGADSIGSVGYYLNDVKFDMSARNIAEPNDIVGTFMERVFANLVITMRLNTAPMSSMSFDFAPNFLDEAKNRAVWIDAVETRLFTGIDLESVRSNQTLSESKNLITFARKNVSAFPKFKTEQSLIRNMYLSMIDAISVPGNPRVSGERGTPYEAGITSNPDIVKEAAAKIPMYGGRYFVVLDKSATSALEMVSTLIKLSAMEQSKEITIADLKPVLDLLNSFLPKEGEKMTSQQLLEMMEKAFAFSNENQKNATLVRAIAFILKSEDLVGEALIKKAIEKTKSDDPETIKEAVAEFDLDSVYKELKLENAFNAKSIQTKAEFFVKMNKEMSEAYSRNKHEYDAQRTLLLKIMASFPEL